MDTVNSLQIKLIFFYLIWLTPIVLICILGKLSTIKQKDFLFFIGLVLSFYLSHNFYDNYLSWRFLFDINTPVKEQIEIIEAHRDIVFRELIIKSNLITLFYTLLIGYICYILLFQKRKKIPYLLFINRREFFIVVFIGMILDLNLHRLYPHWKASSLSVLLILFVIYKIFVKREENIQVETKKRSKKSIWLFLFLIVIFYMILFF